MSLETSEFEWHNGTLVRLGKNKYVMMEKWNYHGNAIHNFNMKSDDIVIMTMPRSGTTVTSEMIWLLNNNLDYETASKIRLEERVHELELNVYDDSDAEAKYASVDRPKFSYEIAENITGPRILKTHLAISLFKNILSSGAKIVYVARDPKDRLVSAMRFLNNLNVPRFKTDIRRMWHDVKNKTLVNEPYWSHVQEAWCLRNQPNVLFLFYEDIRTNLYETIKKAAHFLDKTYSDEEIQSLACHLDIEKFRKNPMVNSLAGIPFSSQNFIGQGKIGGYKDVIPDDIDHEIDEWIEENLKDCFIDFPSLKNKIK
ncbi:hypothetical protein HCN44_001513 [Aphidius gifuensis]|uniref:Sulfotransferase domain-containing protein n=1 Tax=Aphidius gifuensis TaxID=684658 RepID=A0A834XRN2_APHGI|nr:luciferin sulfotransferase-like [Aphidius gifuensis]KAF7992188.1 hypothetical protein HCN44_001513 [Aphidius gifuensis]